MDKKLKTKCIWALRRISSQSQVKADFLKKVRTRDHVGTFKNGNPKYLYKYPCNHCGVKFAQNEVDVDHVIPVVDPAKGFQDWNTYFERMFCDISNFQCLCKPCHKIKTKAEKVKK